MQDPLTQQQQFDKYFHLFWQKKWLILAPALLFPVAAVLYAVRLPDQYKSTTLILVQGQKVPSTIVPSTSTTTIEERLNTISQQILSRTRLEAIIQEFNLFARLRTERAPEEVIETMRKRIELKVHRQDAFQLSYVDENPRVVMLVTNKLASLFIEENLKSREQQAMGTSQFLGEEIERVREQVRAKETEIYSFKSRNMNQLNDQLASNQANLSQLQNQLQVNSQALNSAEERKVGLQQQLSDIEAQLQEQVDRRRAGARAAGGRRPGDSGGNDPGGAAGRLPLEEELAQRRSELAALTATLKARHPDVVRLKTQIQELEKEAQRRVPAGGTAGDEIRREYPPAYGRVKEDLLRTDREIASLKAQNAEIQKGIQTYQARIAATGLREMELQKVSEDSTNLKRVLDDLVNKKLQADLSESMERKQKGEQFQILDPANLAEKPFSPNRLSILLMGVGVGLAGGIGLVLLLDFSDTSLKTKDELGALTAVPVVGIIPVIQTTQDLRRRQVLRYRISGAVAVSLFVAAGIVHFAVKPLPVAVGDLYTKLRNTKWTTMK